MISVDELFKAANVRPWEVPYYLNWMSRISTGPYVEPQDFLQNECGLLEIPVPVEVFLKSPSYMGKHEAIYPPVMEELIEMNCGKYVEVVLTGGIGSGKTTAALYTTAYQLYLLSILADPHRTYGLDPASEILFIFQNKTERLAKNVDFNRFKASIESSPYFQDHFRFNPKVESRLVFPNRIQVVPVSGEETAAIGQNVMGGVIDELNYMEIVEKSRKSIDAKTYDQAVAVYNSIARRRKSRFMQQGKLPGILCLVSSRRYPGQFTDRKEQEAKTDPTIYVYDKTVWDIKPDAYSGRRFNVFVGDLSRRPYIMERGEEYPESDADLIKSIPEEHRTEFETDIINALREIAGVSTLSRSPFFLNQEKVAGSFGKLVSILSDRETDFVYKKIRLIIDNMVDKDNPRFIHVDLGLTSDSAGVSCGRVAEFVRVQRKDVIEVLPRIELDFTLRVRPPRNDEISFEKIRSMIYQMREFGLNIVFVSFDSFQSRDSIQILKQQRFTSGLLSVDKDTLAYDVLKTCIYDGRLSGPPDDWVVKELVSLERVPEKNKVDHPELGSKDVADSLAGVVYGLTIRNEIWAYHSVPPYEIPESLRQQIINAEGRMKSLESAKKDNRYLDFVQ